MKPASLPPIESLLPHRGAMLWLERLTAAEPEAVSAALTVRPGAWYVEVPGGMPAWLGIELMAQTIAAHVGMRGFLAGKPPKPGVLLGCRAYQARVPSFAAGAELSVSARVAYRDEGGFGAYDCSICCSADGELATGTLKVYEPEDFARFLREASAAR
jgi:predicted hotdog family 3-hydroxylacyl-ACP dehydratase